MATTKTYKSNCGYATTFMINGIRRHIAFYSHSFGGGYFATCDEDLQKALEAGPDFGKVYVLASTEESKPVAEEPVAEDTPKEKTQVKVSGMSDAKDYLATNHGYARSNLRTKTSILKAAEENNIEFIGL